MDGADLSFHLLFLSLLMTRFVDMGKPLEINILCNRPILLMEQICATVVVQFLQCSLHCAMWPVYICKGLLGQYYCIDCLFVHVLLEFGAIVVSLG